MKRRFQHAIGRLAEEKFIERSDFFIVVQFLQQGLDREALDRVNEIRRHFGQRFEHKAALVELRVRNRQGFGAKNLVVEEEQVEIDVARRPAVAAGPAEQSFDFLQQMEKPHGVERSAQFQYAVQVPGLFFSAQGQRLGFIEMREAVDLHEGVFFEQANGLADVFEPIPQIAADTEVGAMFPIVHLDRDYWLAGF